MRLTVCLEFVYDMDLKKLDEKYIPKPDIAKGSKKKRNRRMNMDQASSRLKK